jgi:apolipoprotein N-acyltransferase
VNRLIPYFWPVLSGGLLVFAFPGADIGILAWAALVPLLISLNGKTPFNALKYGFASGFVFYMASLSWLIYTMSVYGGIPKPISIILHISLSCYLGLYFGAFGYLYALAKRHTPLSPILFAPVFWVVLELVRNYIVTGFPWNLLGYTQHDTLGVIQIADITGVYGVSALIVMVNAAISELVVGIRGGKPKGASWYSSTAGCAVLMVCVLGYGNYRLTNQPISEKTLKVGLVQGNIDQSVKWDQDMRLQVFETYADMTLGLAEAKPDLVVWPETAVPFALEDESGMDLLYRVARSMDTNLMTGVPSFTEMEDGSYEGRNSAVLISSDGELIGRYDKIHLVPFGEYVPLQEVLPFVRKMVYGIGDFVPGECCTLMGAEGWNFGTAICYEVVFPELVREFPDAGADFLVSVTNDAWFGESSAPYQHFAMARFRAVENRRTLIRAANTGITGVILPDGSVSARTDIYTKGYVVREIPLLSEKTFYTRHGDIFAYLCLLGARAITARAFIYRRGLTGC